MEHVVMGALAVIMTVLLAWGVVIKSREDEVWEWEKRNVEKENRLRQPREDLEEIQEEDSCQQQS